MPHSVAPARLACLAASAVLLAVSGCGGGSSGSSAASSSSGTVTSPPVSTVLSGTAATGAAVRGEVAAIDANGKVFTATANAQGAFSLDVAGGTAPFLLTVTGMSGGRPVVLTSVALSSGQVANITTLTDLIVSAAAGQPAGAELSVLCTSGAAADAAQCKSVLATVAKNAAQATTTVSSIVAPLNSAGNNPITGAFKADGSGMDAVLDAIIVKPALAQGATATVALAAAPAQQLGSVALPASAGTLATVAAVVPAASALAEAANATTVANEIRTCTTAFGNLFPASMITAPTAAQVAPFFDASFSMGKSAGQADAIAAFSSLRGSNEDGLAAPGVGLPFRSLSEFDFSARATAAEILSKKVGAVADSTAWVQLDGSALNSGVLNWKMVKGAAYAGCPGGWKFAGTGYFAVDLNARVTKRIGTGGATYLRSLAFHLETTDAQTEGIGSLAVNGNGLNRYSGNPAAPVGDAAPLVLLPPPAVTAPAVPAGWMVIQGGSGDELSSCQDLASQGGTAGTPCFDETKVSSTSIFLVSAYAARTPGGVPLYAFPQQLSALPASQAFLRVNDQKLFAQNIAATPASPAALNTAAASVATGAALDGIIKFTFTQSPAFNARTDHCGIGVSSAANAIILRAEQDATGMQSGCTFTQAGLNSGSLAKPPVAFGGSFSYLNVGNFVLGMQAGVIQSY